MKFNLPTKQWIYVFFIAAVMLSAASISPLAVVHAQTGTCTNPFQHVSLPLNDLGNQVYIRMDGQNTGELGGLYPGGTNQRPPAHTAAGIELANQVTPLNTNGAPDPVNGRIVMVSVGMSNTRREFSTFMDLVNTDAEINSKLTLVNGAQPAQVASEWVDPNAPTWVNLNGFLADAGLTPAQVQVAWVKLTLYNPDLQPPPFPDWSLTLETDLEAIARNLKTNYPNIKLAFFSSRIFSYVYFTGHINPEPFAFESGFSVRWMIEKQLDGDPSLNFHPEDGPVVAPFLSWGPYLWADGTNPRSDGLTYVQEDLETDCTHPTNSARAKVASMLMDFFKNDPTTYPWFLENPPPPPPTPTSSHPTPTATDTTVTPGPSPTLPPATPSPNPSGTPVGPFHRIFFPVLKIP